MVTLHNVDLVEYKPLRSSPRMRLLFDVGEVTPEVVLQLHKLRMKGDQQISLIITDTEDLREVAQRSTSP